VQLANYIAGPNNKWPELREAQTQTLGLRNTGMAVTIDIGDPKDIHPRNKQAVGTRLGLAARAIAYGEKVEFSGPMASYSHREGSNGVRVWFDHSEGLTARGGAVKGFEVAGADGKFVPAEAMVDGRSVVVKAAEIQAPAAVRYGWADSPECNLYNSAGLPASPFRAQVRD
jgi:sialate O-acetylesterase